MILIVDDNPDVCRVLRRQFERAGEPAAWTTEPREAARTVEALRPAAVVLDLTMPAADGIDVTAQIRGRPDPAVAGVPVVMFSAVSDPAMRSVAAAAGVSDYVVKGCEFAELRERVTRLLRGRRDAAAPEC